jgi:Rod binding domain-containing protein
MLTLDIHQLQQIQHLGDGRNLDPAQKAALQKRKLIVACQGFESMFWHMILKGMRQSVLKSNWLDGGLKQRITEDMLDQVLADRMAASGQVGLAKMLMNQLQGVRQYQKTFPLAPAELKPPAGGGQSAD